MAIVGECNDDETAEADSKREFEEETGLRPTGVLLPLGEAIQAGGAMPGDLDATRIDSVSCEVEWPPKSGQLVRVPEVDRAAWFTLDDARAKIIKGQGIFLDRLEQILRPVP